MQFQKRGGLAALVLGVLACATAGQVSTETTAKAAIEEVLDELLARGVPGVSAAIDDANGQRHRAARGVSSEGKPLTPDHRFLSGSVGKTYAAAVVHGLVLQGVLSWDAYVADAFGGEEWVERLPGKGAMTLRQLLRHETGLPRYVFQPGFFGEVVAEPDRVWRPEELLAYVFDEEALFEAGKGWAYADTNYIVAGMWIEAVTERAFYDVARELLLEPHGLEDTLATNRRDLPGMAQGHIVGARPMGFPAQALEDGSFVYNVQFEWCGGGWASTAADLAHWIRLFYSGAAFEGDYVADLRDTVPAPALGPGVRYGLGCMERETPLGPLVYHDGFMPGYLTSAGYFPKLGVGVALHLNVDDASRVGRPLSEVLVELAQTLPRR